MSRVLLDKLYEVFKDFYNLTKFKIVLFDNSRMVVASYPEGMCRFCDEVRRSPHLAKRCFACDKLGFDTVDKTGKPYIYRCHMAATEAIAPIFAGEETVGYLMFGQIINTDKGEIQKIADLVNKENSICISSDMIDEMRYVDEEYLRSAVNMMSLCASYLYTAEIVVKDSDILAYRIAKYVEENIKEVSLLSICKRFYISRSRLYSVASENFHLGISDYIREKRLSLAKKLLLSSDKSVSEIAEDIGMKNTNYFIRIFKRQEGITPLKYREKMRKCK